MSVQPTKFLWGFLLAFALQAATPLDYGRKIEIDPDGNVIVAGISDDGAGTRRAIFILKYSGTGVALWTNHYSGSANGDHEVVGLAVDKNGNVFVVENSNRDYTTVAYSSTGVALWTNHYSGPANNSYDEPSGLAVDDNGNVFVTGASEGDCVTIAYSGAGVPLWTNRYPDGGAHAVAVGGGGNVFVTGSAKDDVLPIRRDYATIAYSGGGIPLWTNRYNGPGGDSEDIPRAIAVDGSGNVFVTGSSSLNGSNSGSVTIAYSRMGIPLWTNRFNLGATSLAVDHIGNVFVTGNSGNNITSDYATVAYSGAGVTLWTNFYAEPRNSYDHTYASAVDNSGNLLVTGTSAGDYATIKYSGAGVALWTNRYDISTNLDSGAFDVAVDSSGNVFVTGISVRDCATLVYSAAGVALWTNRYGWRPQLAIQPPAVGSSTVRLVLSGTPNSSWSVERALMIGGPWTSLGPSLIGTNGVAIFSDATAPPNGAFYRLRLP